MTFRTVGLTPGVGDGARFDDNTQVLKLEYGAEGEHNPLDEKPAVASKQDTANTKLDTLVAGIEALLSELYGKTEPADTQAVSAASLPLPTGAATEASLAAIAAAVHAEDSAHVSGDAGIMMLAIRSDSDVPTAEDGEYTTPKLDEEGRLKVASKPASYADITGNITAIQASISVPVAGGTVEGNVSRASNVMAFCTGTFNTVNCSFEGSLESSGDTNWFSIQAVRTNANTIETSTGNLSAQPTYAWEMSVNGLKRVRVRCTALTSGTQAWRFVLGTYATEPIPAAQTPGTVTTQGNVAHDAAASGNPTTVAVNARTTDYTAVASNDIARWKGTTVGAGVVWPYQVPELSWNYPAPASGIVNTTTAVTLKAAAGAGVRNYMCQIAVSWDALTNATEAVVRDGASGTVLWRHKIPSGAAGRTYEQFAIPKKSTANTLLEFATLTASGAGGVYPNCDGFTAP